MLKVCRNLYIVGLTELLIQNLKNCCFTYNKNYLRDRRKPFNYFFFVEFKCLHSVKSY